MMCEERTEDVSAEETSKEEEQLIKRHEALTERFTHLTSSQIIQRAVLIETALENIVAFQFCGNNYERYLPFRTLIFRDGRIDYADKIKMVKKLIKTEYPLIYEQISPLFN